jgi:hypothetical protein
MSMNDQLDTSNCIFAHLGDDAKASIERIASLIELVTPIEVNSVIFQPHANYEIDEDIIELVAEWGSKGQPYLYTFHLVGEFDVSAVSRAFVDAKNNLNTRKFSKFISKNDCLYVGGSRDLAKRFKEHLGFGSAATYALQLSHWAPSLLLNIRFSAALYPVATTNEVLQLLEDTLWDKRKPMFGKRGGK